MAFLGSASIWAKVALLLVIVAIILQIVGIATHYWMQIETNSESTAYSIGLWKAVNCPRGSSCDTQDIPDAFNDANLKATQGLQIIVLIFIFIILVVLVTYVSTERFREIPVAIFILVACFVTVTFGIISMIIWLAQIPDLYYPGYSFGLAVTATLLLFFAGLLMIPDLRQFNSRRRPKVMQVKPEGYGGTRFYEPRETTPYNRKYAGGGTQVMHYHNPNRDANIRSPPPTYRTSLQDDYPSKPSYGRDIRTEVQTPDVYLGRISSKIRRY